MFLILASLNYNLHHWTYIHDGLYFFIPGFAQGSDFFKIQCFTIADGIIYFGGIKSSLKFEMLCRYLGKVSSRNLFFRVMRPVSKIVWYIVDTLYLAWTGVSLTIRWTRCSYYHSFIKNYDISLWIIIEVTKYFKLPNNEKSR